MNTLPAADKKIRITHIKTQIHKVNLDITKSNKIAPTRRWERRVREEWESGATARPSVVPHSLFIQSCWWRHASLRMGLPTTLPMDSKYKCHIHVTILLVANENMHLKLTAVRARGLSFPARAPLSLSLSASALKGAVKTNMLLL